ncbi:MAG TPA: FtsX-like permease family protein [Longimicrobiaceae bacterium]|nr:FtsX-like permease family protein [Longimicrobiaceae bacterium]
MSQIRTILALAWRESRFARRRLFLFLSAISLGVAALVSVQGFAATLQAGVRDQARELLGADLRLGSRQPFGSGTEALLDSLRGAGLPVAQVTSFVSMALVPRTEGTRLVQVQATEPGFPFYGRIVTDPPGLWEELHAGPNALVDPALLIGLGARVGDTLALGEGRFRILGSLETVPGQVEIASAFAPRVYIPARYLEQTGLVQFGSRVEYEAYLRLANPAAGRRLVAENRPLLRGEQVRSRTAEEQQENLTEALGRLGSYLGLIGVFALLLGGIGVASAMRAYMAQKAETIATLRCLGATAPQLFAVYLVQAAAMGLVGASLGVMIGVGAQWVLPGLAAGLLPVEVQPRIDVPTILTGLGVGVWIALAFALLPLLETRRISPLQALRRRVEPLRVAGRDPWRWAAWATLAASVLLLIVLQAGNLRVGTSFTAGVGITLALLWLAAWTLTRGVRRFSPRGLLYPLRHGLANLHRPGNQTRVVMLALGFGVFLLATLFLTQENLLRPLRPGGELARRANLLFWDVQADQAAPLAELLRGRELPVLQQAPIVPMRIAAVNGRPVRSRGLRDGDAAEAGEEAGPPDEAGRQPAGWALRREYRSTFRDTVVASERIREGSWWTASREAPEPGSPGEVSLERGVAEELGVGIGDLITWDVQGVEIPTLITSLREVDWARFEPNFFAVFPPAVLEGAPHTWVVLTQVADEGARARLQRETVERYPNISALDLTQVQAAVDETIGRISVVIRFLALFSVATGFVVLLGAVSVGRLQRIRESVLLKTLGATRRQIGSILFFEYLLLGALASLIGVALAIAAGWALARWLFRIGFGVPALPLAALGTVVALLAVAVGLWASREVYRRTPLEALREE